MVSFNKVKSVFPAMISMPSTATVESPSLPRWKLSTADSPSTTSPKSISSGSRVVWLAPQPRTHSSNAAGSFLPTQMPTWPPRSSWVSTGPPHTSDNAKAEGGSTM